MAAPTETKTGEAEDEMDTADNTGAPASTSVQEHPAGLTDEQLMEVFKQTSIFNVRSALANNDAHVHH